MKNLTNHTGILRIIQRLPSSYYGNPRYMLSVDNIRFITSPDSMQAYGITNFSDKLVNVSLGLHYGKTTLNDIKAA